MILNFTIIPVFRRDLVAAAREREGRRLHSERSSFAGMLAAIVVVAFGAWLYWSDGYVTNRTMARGVNEAVGWCGLVHFGVFGSILLRGAWAIARERERGTLEFLLATPMTNAEIVLGKLASCVVMVCTTMAGGLPVVLLLHVLGGIDLWLIALCYASAASSILFLSSLAIWISAEAPGIRLAYAALLLGTLAWVIGPFSAWVFIPRFGIRVPEWVAAANGWLVLSSPISVAFYLATGVNSWVQLSYIVGRMIALQLLGVVFLTIAAIVRLRSAHRTIVSGDQRARGWPGRGPVWRFRRRPPVGDDPILWREMYTTRGNGLWKAVGVLGNLGLLAALAYATYYFARPAMVEVWRHGYGSGVTSNARPEFNLFVRMFVPGGGVNPPLDLARTEFNLFLRYVTSSITLLLTFLIAVNATETITLERRKETWNSLLATPMTARAILQSAFLATVWRIRQPIAILGVLWTMGLLAGAIHPLGYLLAMLNLAASVWLFTVWGVRASVRARDQAAAAGLQLQPRFPHVALPGPALPAPRPIQLGALGRRVASFRRLDVARVLPRRPRRTPLRGRIPPWSGWELARARDHSGRLRRVSSGSSPLPWADGGPGDTPSRSFDRLVGRPWRAEAAADPASRLKSLPTPKPGVPVGGVRRHCLALDLVEMVVRWPSVPSRIVHATLALARSQT